MARRLNRRMRAAVNQQNRNNARRVAINSGAGGPGVPVGSDVELFTTAPAAGDQSGIIAAVPRGLFISPDETSVYTADDTGDKVRRGTITAGDLSTYAAHSETGDLGRPFSVAIGNSGEFVYIDNSTSIILRRTCSTPDDMSTLGGTDHTIDVSVYMSNVRGMHMSFDGTKFFAASGNGEVDAYSLSTPFDLSSGSVVGSYDATEMSTNSWGCTLDASGTRMYLCHFLSDRIYQYNLGTAWDVSTAVYHGAYIQLTGVAANSPCAVHINGAGDALYIHLFDTAQVVKLVLA